MILVDIYIPAIDETYNFELDENVRIEHVIKEVVEMITKKTKSMVASSAGEFLLYDMADAKALQKEYSLCLLGIKNGARLMLV